MPIEGLHQGAGKGKSALVAIVGYKKPAELAQQFEVHLNQRTNWKRQLSKRSHLCFWLPSA